MKAKDYHNKYGEQLVSPDGEVCKEALLNLLQDFAKDTQALMDQRKVQSNRACMAVIDEMNARWNALVEMLEVPVLKRNGWKDYFMSCLNRASM